MSPARPAWDGRPQELYGPIAKEPAPWRSSPPAHLRAADRLFCDNCGVRLRTSREATVVNHRRVCVNIQACHRRYEKYRELLAYLAANWSNR